MSRPHADPRAGPGGALRRQSIRILRKLGYREDTFLLLLAGLIGLLTGIGSVAFTKLIHFCHALCYHKQTGVYAGKSIFLIVLPAAAALLVGLVTRAALMRRCQHELQKPH